LNMREVIRRKRDGKPLEEDVIRRVISGYVAGEIGDGPMAALLMAIWFRGLGAAETRSLTLAMAASGTTLDLSAVAGPKVDKHSTGGVGDTTSLVLCPLVAACGVTVPKMSGRGLDHTGGTIDKLEAIEGFDVNLSTERFVGQLQRVGLAVGAQTQDLAPADKLIYSLRDMTATVDSVPLIAASIMSKKLAGGADAVVLDVKVGRGAFMRDLEAGRRLAGTMVRLGRDTGLKTVAVLSRHDAPLGRAVGNALEVAEAVRTLRGEGPDDLTELCLRLGGIMLTLAGKAADAEQGRLLALEALRSGRALERFAAWVEAQRGDAGVVDHPDRLPQAPHVVEVTAGHAGCVQGVDALHVGMAALALGAGRTTKDAPVDPAVGITLAAVPGDPVARGDVLARIHARDRGLEEAAGLLRRAYSIGSRRPGAGGTAVLEVIGPE